VAATLAGPVQPTIVNGHPAVNQEPRAVIRAGAQPIAPTLSDAENPVEAHSNSVKPTLLAARAEKSLQGAVVAKVDL